MLLGLFAKGTVVVTAFAGAVVGSRIFAVAQRRQHTPPPNSGNNLNTDNSLTPSPSLEALSPPRPESDPIQQPLKDSPSKTHLDRPQLTQKAQNKLPSPAKLPKPAKPPKVKEPKTKTPKLSTKPEAQKLTHPKVEETKTPEQIFEEARNSIKKLKDYTFKLTSPCSQGTAWILDYRLTNDEKYPTIWYFATTADTIRKWIFTSNEYVKRLPVSISESDLPRKRGDDYHGKAGIMKNLLNDEHSCVYSTQYGMFDISITQDESIDKLEGLMNTHKIRRPKLFYSAVDFWNITGKQDIPKQNYKDFVVLEIEFTNPEHAQKITNDFATNYKNKTKAINVFSEAIDIKKVDTNNENYYSLAYLESKRGKGFEVKRESNWQEGLLTSSVLSTTYPHTHVYQKGHVPQDTVLISKAGLQWGNNTTFWESGYFYSTKGNTLGKGSSGALGIDGKGNVLGIKHGQEQEDYSLYTPLRSNEINGGKMKTPKYDLILGADGQNGSYKEQVENNIVKKNLGQTWLSTFDAWIAGKPSNTIS